MPSIDARRQSEFDKYAMAYARQEYRMGRGRWHASCQALESIDCRGSYLDIGCGRGEMLAQARRLGFAEVAGTEVIPDLLGPGVTLASIDALPFADSSFDVVSAFDVLEHILPEDTEIALAEVARVAGRHAILTAANYSSMVDDVELHINRRPYAQWHELIRAAFPGSVRWQPRINGCNSELWVIDL